MNVKKKGIRVNFGRDWSIEDEIYYDDSTRIDGIYYNTSKGIIPIAYIYPIENRAKLESLIKTRNEAAATFAKLEAAIMYMVFTIIPQRNYLQ